jgi:hypothetical protein
VKPSRLAIALVVAVAVAIAAGVYLTRDDGPQGDPGEFAVGVVRLIVMNRYSEAWSDLHPIDQRVAPKGEYVGCENRSRFSAKFVRATPGPVTDEAVGLGNGRFVRSKAVEVRVTLKEQDLEPFVVRHTMHVVPSGSKWTWILPSWRYVDFRDGRCASAPRTDSQTS